MRDAPEVQASGKVAGAVHVSRGMLEFRADPDLPSHDKNFSKDKTVILYCGSGGRAALAGKMLKDLGYEQVFNLGGFKDWADFRRRGREVNRADVAREAAPWRSPHRGCDIAAVDGGDVGRGLQRQRLMHKRLRHILGRHFAAEQIAAHIVFFT